MLILLKELVLFCCLVAFITGIIIAFAARLRFFDRLICRSWLACRSMA